MRARGSLGILCLAALAGCAVPRLSNTPDDAALAVEVRGPGLLFEVRYPRDDAAEADRIGGGLLAAGPRLSRWGEFRHGVTVRLLPDHEALEALVGLHGYPWLRAWAFGDQILLQSPRSWDPSASLQDEITELLAHELTHALMYQLLQPAAGGFPEEPPLWFREGMASVTAGQGHRRLTLDQLRTWQKAHPDTDLLRPTAELYRTEKEAVYAAAHRAFELLVVLRGDQSIREVLNRAGSGARFDDAFAAATGQPLLRFETDAVRSGYSASFFRPRLPFGAGGD
ncbi:MAG TPA: hypothetical protein VE964_15320 [Myxococcales bacterium]|nr:hypothetical protein [Myxococcales bacterium]